MMFPSLQMQQRMLAFFAASIPDSESSKTTASSEVQLKCSKHFKNASGFGLEYCNSFDVTIKSNKSKSLTLKISKTFCLFEPVAKATLIFLDL